MNADRPVGDDIIPPLGRLPPHLLASFDIGAFARPTIDEDRWIAAWEQEWGCHVVTYKAGCAALSGPSHLCSNAYAARLSIAAREELLAIECRLNKIILVAYERPWRWRSSFGLTEMSKCNTSSRTPNFS